MKKIVLIYGFISGLIVSGIMYMYMPDSAKDLENIENGQWWGYGTMVIGLSLIFFAIKSYRDKYLGGTIKFGKAFLTGIYITLIAGSMYALTWEGLYRNMDGDFMAIYKDNMVKEMHEKKMPEKEIQSQVADMDKMAEMYKNPLFRFAFSCFAEFFPVGLGISLISALILMRKTPKLKTAVA